MSVGIFDRIGALACAIALLAGSGHAALAAACKAGDLAGDWSLYSIGANAPNIGVKSQNYTICTSNCGGVQHDLTVQNEVKTFDNDTGTIIWCSIRLTTASSSPIKYNISGNCKVQGVLKTQSKTATVSGTASITETAACGVTGGFTVTANKVIPVTILDAKIDSATTRKTHGTGVAQMPDGINPNNLEVMLFNLQR